MGSNIIELAKLGHERSAELKASCGAVDVRSLAQLISDLATQLEVQFVRSTNQAVQLANAESKRRELQRDNDSLEAVAVSMRDDMRDAREKLEELDNSLCELLPGTQYMDPPDGGSVTPLEQVRLMVADYRGCIEELESRELAVKQFDDFQIVHYGGSEDYAKGYIDCQNNYNKALAAAGIGVKGE